jgi:hypothetical protein
MAVPPLWVKFPQRTAFFTLYPLTSSRSSRTDQVCRYRHPGRGQTLTRQISEHLSVLDIYHNSFDQIRIMDGTCPESEKTGEELDEES